MGRFQASIHKSSRAFFRDERGDVALLLGLSLVVLMAFIGAGVDMARLANVRDKTIASMDSAVLAAGRALQTGASTDAAVALASKVYKANTDSRSGVANDTVSFSVVNNGTSVAAKGTVLVDLPFLRFIGLKQLPALSLTEASEASMAQERSTGTDREIVLMLDVSGSMCDPCSKRDAMKLAAKDLIDIMMQNNSNGSYISKVALVPFSGDVRPPHGWLAKLTDPAAPNQITKTVGRARATYARSSCVGERVGQSRYAHTVPSTDDRILPAYNNAIGSCIISARSQIVPLSDSADALKSAVDKLETGGGTAGHVGTAWAYYMLSPDWGSIVPAASKAAEFGSDKVRKIAVLMTDGEYNSERDSVGLPVGAVGAGQSANSKTSSDQAVELCKSMKADGIEVYTVGFDLGGNQRAIETLSSCASDSHHSYLVADSEALQVAFKDIAIKLSELHLSK